MMRFHTTVTAGLAALLAVPVLIGQGSVSTLQDALSGTKRALEVLKGLEQKLGEDPVSAFGLVLSATEAPGGNDEQRDERLETLRSEVNLLQMEFDAMQSPAMTGDGAVQGALGTRAPLTRPSTLPSAGVTTGIDDSLRALLSGAPMPRPVAPTEPTAGDESGAATSDSAATPAYSADPLRHGITCYRAGRYAEAYELLAPLEEGSALYWQARTLERLERLDEAV